VPTDVSVECDAVPAAPIVTASDACDPSVPVTFGEATTPGRCPESYTITRTWSAVDDCGNSVSRSQIITVDDTQAPTLSGVPDDATVECDAVPPPGTPSAADNCDPAPRVTLSESRATGRCASEYVLTRTWTATDACGNAFSRSQVITVEDTTPPVVQPPDDLVVECPPPPSGPQSEDEWAASAGATDNCGPAQAFSRLVSRAPGCGNTFLDTHEFWAVDECGLESARILRTYTVVDATPPILVAPDDFSVECPAAASGPGSESAWLLSATASDACGSARVLSAMTTSVDGCGATIRNVHEFWAVDECGNESARVQRTFEVVDTRPPAFSIEGDQFRLSLWPPNHGYVVYSTMDVVSASDDCGSVRVRATGCASSQPEEVHQGDAGDGANGDGRTFEDCVVSVDGSQFALRAERLGNCGKDAVRTYSVEFTATDECGNTSPGTGRVVVEHDRSGHQDSRRGRKLGPNDPPPFPHLHATVYGTGCR
jgi:hypothetical protein